MMRHYDRVDYEFRRDEWNHREQEERNRRAGLLLAQDCCPHPSPHTILREWLTQSKVPMQYVRCESCGREWHRWRDASGEDV